MGVQGLRAVIMVRVMVTDIVVIIVTVVALLAVVRGIQIASTASIRIRIPRLRLVPASGRPFPYGLSTLAQKRLTNLFNYGRMM